MNPIAYCKIHPGIGIARLGDSPDQYFVGPEAPSIPAGPEGGFKDPAGRIKRQAARFRIYAYDQEGNVLGELTAAEATIHWTVQLANRKAAAPQFQDRFQTKEPPLRNADIADRSTLEITPGARTIAGAGQAGAPYRFDGGRCFGVEVPLGELRTDEAGRLLVLGGHGHSDSPAGADISTYANNEGWYDDTSDGPVTAAVTLADGIEIADVRPAWVIVAPPKFAPAHHSIVTLYDVMRQVALDQGWLAPDAAVSFTRDIYPILERAAAYQWINATAYRGHGADPGGNFTSHDFLAKLADPGAGAAAMRQAIFARLRTPGKLDPAQANFYYMPQLSGDGGDATDGDPTTWLTLTPAQYEAMRRWAAGDFAADWTGAPPAVAALAQIPLPAQPGALDRAALEWCIGGPFYPGIEMTYIALDPAMYAEPFRLTPALQPGDITKHMALPWQADFYQCNTYWWPAARPDDVFTADGGEPQPWARGLSDQGPDPDYLHRRTGDSDLVRYWSQLGFVVPRQAPDGRTVYVESERRPYAGLDTRDFFYRMLNLASYPDFRARARELAEEFLNKARGEAPDFAQLDAILDAQLQQDPDYDPAADPVFRSRADVVEQLRQLAPLYQLHFAWLRQCLKGGPVDQVHGLLFSIWQEVNGGGQTEQCLPNLYTTLLHSVDLDLAPVDSQAYAQNQDLLESAFTLPFFALCLSEFTESYLPELLGLTLAAAWTAANQGRMVALLRKYRIDAHFFSAGQGLANAIDGHAARAKQAVKLYLDEVRSAAGEEAMAAAWQRVWTGFVAYSTISELQADLQYLLEGRRKPDLQAQVEALILQKQPYGQVSHGDGKLGPNYINDWFQDPTGFLAEMVKQGLLVPGDPDHSPFFRMLTFDGPMYKVFSDDEIELLKDYVRGLKAKP